MLSSCEFELSMDIVWFVDCIHAIRVANPLFNRRIEQRARAKAWEGQSMPCPLIAWIHTFWYHMYIMYMYMYVCSILYTVVTKKSPTTYRLFNFLTLFYFGRRSFSVLFCHCVVSTVFFSNRSFSRSSYGEADDANKKLMMVIWRRTKWLWMTKDGGRSRSEEMKGRDGR